VLAQYDGTIAHPIVWKDHGKVDLDTWAHYFDDAMGREFVLLYEDFPGSGYLNDLSTHEIIPLGAETNLRITLSNDSLVDNVAGYFTLYREKTH
jgi:hypothetical protein